MFASASASLITALSTGVPAGKDVFGTVDSLGSSTENSISGLGPAIGCVVALVILFKAGGQVTLLKTLMAALVGACAGFAVQDWDLFTSTIVETFKKATGQG